MMDITTLFYALGGVVVGWMLQVITAEIRERREIRRAVSTSAAKCLARLKKMEMARLKSKDSVFIDEKGHLGSDSDEFLQAIARRSKISDHEMSIYKRISELLIGVIEEDSIDKCITELIDDVQHKITYSA
jgi:uncharacterized membrane protein YheB (UPF0754 family)